VLVVEDDADIRESLIEILEESGFPTVGAANGHETLERLRAPGQPPCLILLDLVGVARRYCADCATAP
jgi:CheY-like chemotaxis protein